MLGRYGGRSESAATSSPSASRKDCQSFALGFALRALLLGGEGEVMSLVDQPRRLPEYLRHLLNGLAFVRAYTVVVSGETQ
jgi:hypothetical protein